MPYVVHKSGSGYKVFKKGSSKSFSKKPMTKEKAKAQQKALYANESLDTVTAGSNLEFKSAIPTMDSSEVAVFYRVKSEPNTDLILIYSLGKSAEDTDYLYGVIRDKNDPKGRPKKFEDPSTEETVAMLKIFNLTPDDIEMAGQDGYDKIAEKIFTSSETLKDPYEEGLEFEKNCNKILNENEEE